MTQNEKLYYDARKLSEFPINTPVVDKDGYFVGHVIGFGVNSTHEVILNVLTCYKEERLIHPSNLKLLAEVKC
jgi:hypothetical protein